ncbi:MAG: dCTP deaminase [SAR324 cluster bacterium]|nr:dCTP deaminase [SAR324 cluster bacterium]
MILSDVDLKKLVEQGYLPPGLNIGPSSVDLTLSNSFSWLMPKEEKIILGNEVSYQSIESDTFTIQANQFILASTEEFIRVPDDMAAYVEGRSSVGRLGLQVQNASFIDGGFHGKITLELENQSGYPIELRAGIRICQIVYFNMTTSAESPYHGKYNNQDRATPSRLDQDFDIQH